jgi:hypothetical protein
VKTTEYHVDFRYTRDELLALFALANREDVEQGGRYDARSAAINIWSHSWINDATRYDSDTVGTFYVHWGDKNHLYLIECDDGFSRNDLLHELGILEQEAFGYVKHGRTRL